MRHSGVCRFTFDKAQAHIFLLMKKDSYQRFLRSNEYKALLANAVIPSTKKKYVSLRKQIKEIIQEKPNALR